MQKKPITRWKFNQATLKLHDLTTEDVHNILELQNYACAICMTYFKSTPCIDHDHETLMVRGLLCTRCNTGLGMFKDSVRYLSGAIVYLEVSKRRFEQDLPITILQQDFALRYLDEEAANLHQAPPEV